MTYKTYLRIPEATAEYGISRPLLRKLIRDGRLPSIRPAGARVVLIHREDLERLMDEGRKGVVERPPLGVS